MINALVFPGSFCFDIIKQYRVPLVIIGNDIALFCTWEILNKQIALGIVGESGRIVSCQYFVMSVGLLQKALA